MDSQKRNICESVANFVKMREVITLLVLITTLDLASLSQDMPGMKMLKGKKENKQAEKVIYTCPMHPQVQMDKPGKCPICGMKLVKKTIKISKPNERSPGMDSM